MKGDKTGWVAVDRNGMECLYTVYKPVRSLHYQHWCVGRGGKKSNRYPCAFALKPGTVSGLIGRQLRWSDEPVFVKGVRVV